MLGLRSSLFLFILWSVLSEMEEQFGLTYSHSHARVEADEIEQVLSQHRETGRPIRVAFVHHAMHMGGVERQILLTCEALRLVDPNSTQFKPQIVLFQARAAATRNISHCVQIGN